MKTCHGALANERTVYSQFVNLIMFWFVVCADFNQGTYRALKPLIRKSTVEVIGQAPYQVKGDDDDVALRKLNLRHMSEWWYHTRLHNLIQGLVPRLFVSRVKKIYL